MTIQKVNTGETLEGIDGKKFILMGSTCWAIVNEKNQIVDFFSSKKAAKEYAEYILMVEVK